MMIRKYINPRCEVVNKMIKKNWLKALRVVFRDEQNLQSSQICDFLDPHFQWSLWQELSAYHRICWRSWVPVKGANIYSHVLLA
jgi:hypothetical protein